MKNLGLLLRYLLCISFLIGTWPAQAQDGASSLKELLGAQQKEIQTLQDANYDLRTRVSDLKAESTLIKDLLKNIIATQAADRATALFAAHPETASVAVEAKRKSVDNAIEVVSKIPEGSLPPDLKTRIQSCLSNIKDASANLQQDSGAKIATACSDEEARKILVELEKARTEALKSWEKCRDTIGGLDDIGPVTLPMDPAGLSKEGVEQTRKGIDALVVKLNTKAGDAKDCAKGIKKAFEDIQNSESAAAAMGTALNMAASVCMATGGNPYVCGGMLVIAILLELFGDKGDGGGGEGDGSGPDQGSGITGKGVSGECTQNCSEKPNPTPQVEKACTGDDCVKGLGGDIVCRIISDSAMDCARKNATEPKVRIDASKGILQNTQAEKDLASSIKRKDLSGALFCLTPGSNFIKGLIVPAQNAGKSHQIGVDYNSGEPRLLYPSAAIETPNATPEKVCSASFQ